jgi:polyisoprenoid-binding protein YceI
MAWNIDPTHSNVTFSVRHMVISTVRGSFNILRGTLDIDEEHPELSSIEAEVDTASIETNDQNRNNHLRSADFFDAEQYPVLTFKSTRVEKLDENEFKVTGDLTMHGVTKPVVFRADYSGQVKDPYGLQRVGLHAATKISRKEWGLTWHAALETGGAVVGDEIKIDIDLEAITQPVATA